MDLAHWVLSALQALGPSLVLLVLVVLLFRLLRNAIYPGALGSQAGQNFREPTPLEFGGGFAVALEDAATLNGFDPTSSADPTVNLQSVASIKPTEYKKSTQEILKLYLLGRVVSVDLSDMDKRDASRLVDFVSGMVAARSGWIFRVADEVVVLNPPGSR
ncbi:cell division protein SepF [Saccharopolyspora flava]|uniref:cell division protein SepF n=1 Tax=Saccharopolyspora flava TaxID=95161 RepID=UPI000B8837E3|nr:cell division protein SepF [Saccharopolyspora flava]